MTSERRANDNDPKSPGYALGDLQIIPTGQSSGALPQVSGPSVPGARASSQGLAPAKAAPERPSAARGGAPRNLTLADGDIGPALELDFAATPAALQRVSVPEARMSRQSAPTSNARASAARSGSVPSASAAAVLENFGGASVLDDFDQGGFAKLPQLEVESVDRRSAERVVARDPQEEARTKEREEAEAIRALGRFNDAPDGLLASVPYAFHVAGRVWALRNERAAAVAEQSARASELQAALVAFGHALLLKATDPRMEPLRSKVAHVHDERAKLERADQGVERTREGNQRALDLMRSEAEHLKEELEPYLAAERTALAAQRKAEEDLRRAQAMQKRVEIELRALEAAATVDEARLDALNAQLAQRAATAASLAGVLGQASEGLGKTRRDLAMKRGALDANEEKQKRLEAESRAREQEAEGKKQVANGAYEAALCALAESARKQKLALLAPGGAAKCEACEAALEAAGESVLRFDQALKLYHRNTALKGFAVVAALLAFAVIALSLL